MSGAADGSAFFNRSGACLMAGRKSAQAHHDARLDVVASFAGLDAGRCRPAHSHINGVVGSPSIWRSGSYFVKRECTKMVHLAILQLRD